MKMIPTEPPVSPTLFFGKKRFRHFGLIVKTIDDEYDPSSSSDRTNDDFSAWSHLPPLGYCNDGDDDYDDGGGGGGGCLNGYHSDMTSEEEGYCYSYCQQQQQQDEIVDPTHVTTRVSESTSRDKRHAMNDSSFSPLPLLDAGQTVQFHPRVSKKRVRFGGVEVREYSRVFGDHPLATGGFPLSLGWTYNNHNNNNNHHHQELMNQEDKRDGRPKRLTVEERKRLLRKIGGLTETQLRRAENVRRKRIEQELVFCNTGLDDESDDDDDEELIDPLLQHTLWPIRVA
eukprot:CAMPEP_0116567914 /NCGR_PEP_ID=MMETSP0397-20121206/15297_1 /TAXON_ID=216820 /ORGANISM="Cyclophora tenuis, Strain ECT3854" /LENGTH=285 /DNA_ID=CAMNT_0004095009 /DNA_START=34 /DNA_END=888 /DNA_ORIENTATION=+